MVALLARIIPSIYRHQTLRTLGGYLSFFCYGKKFTCPFCQSSFRRFYPHSQEASLAQHQTLIGMGKRENCYCPRCFSKDRERLVYMYLKHNTSLFREPGAVLHVAPGKSLELVFLRHPFIHYVSIDLRPKRAIIQMDITNLGFKNGLFDLILCNHVLQYIPHDRKAMSELFRVLKPGGFAIIQVPICQSLSNTYDNVFNPPEQKRLRGFKGFVRIYGRDYRDRLITAGFQVEEFDWSLSAIGEQGNIYGLIPKEILYIARKN